MKKRIILAVFMAAGLIFNVCTAAYIKTDKESAVKESVIASETKASVTEVQTEAEKAFDNTTEKASESTMQAQKADKETTVQNEEKTESSTEKHNEEEIRAEQESEKDKIEEKETKPEKIQISLTINCKNAVDWGADVDEYFLKNASYTAEEGATVFDALKDLCSENGIALKYQRKTYIQGISGLNEKACGGGSGWIYLVNGVKPSKPASSYVLENGDVVEWRYVTNPTQ